MTPKRKQRKIGRPPAPIGKRFLAMVSPEPNAGCWLWTGATRKGYGQFGVSTAGGGWKMRSAHIRGAGVAAQQSNKELCKHGHPFTRTRRGRNGQLWRWCETCYRESYPSRIGAA